MSPGHMAFSKYIYKNIEIIKKHDISAINYLKDTISLMKGTN